MQAITAQSFKHEIVLEEFLFCHQQWSSFALLFHMRCGCFVRHLWFDQLLQPGSSIFITGNRSLAKISINFVQSFPKHFSNGIFRRILNRFGDNPGKRF